MRLRLTRRRGKSNRGHALSCPMRVRVRARQLPQKCWPMCVHIVWKGTRLPTPYANMSSYQAWTLPSIDPSRINASHSLTFRYSLLLRDALCPLEHRALLRRRSKIPHIITHLEQHPASASLSLTSIGLTAPFGAEAPLPVEYPCISRLKRRISRTIS